MRPTTRAIPFLAVATCVALGAGGCSASQTGSPVSRVAEKHLEADVLAVMNHNGLPVMDDYIACKIIPDGHTQTCIGQTDDAPVRQIDGDFDRSPGPSAPGSCPGSLTVKVDSVQVEKTQVDPCR